MKATFKKRTHDDLEKFYQQNAHIINSLKQIPQAHKIEIKPTIQPKLEIEKIDKPVLNEQPIETPKTKPEQRKQK